MQRGQAETGQELRLLRHQVKAGVLGQQAGVADGLPHGQSLFRLRLFPTPGAGGETAAARAAHPGVVPGRGGRRGSDDGL
jgi:hypothetical protein